MKLTTKTAKRIEEINEKMLIPAFRTEQRWVDIVRVEKQSLINFKNELKEIIDNSRDYTFNRWHKLNPDELRGIIEEYQEELNNVVKLIQEIESVENARNNR